MIVGFVVDIDGKSKYLDIHGKIILRLEAFQSMTSSFSSYSLGFLAADSGEPI